MHNRRRVFLIFTILIFCVACDQLSKSIVERELPKTKAVASIKGIVSFDYLENKGGVFAFE